MVANVLIIATVVALVALCVRSLVRSGSSCADCSSGSSCAAARGRGRGGCPVAKTMVADAERALGDISRR